MKEEEIDQLIRETLTQEEAQFYDKLEEQNLIGKLSDVYKSKVGWLAIIMNIMHLLLFGFFVYCVYRFFDTENTKELIKWATAGLLSMVFMAMMKLYVWMQMDKNDILRELKRLELQVATLSTKTTK